MTTSIPPSLRSAIDSRPPALKRWLTLALDLLYPPRCGGCGAAGQGWWCEACARRTCSLILPEPIKPLPFETTGVVAGLPSGVEVAVLSAVRFGPPLREGIHAFKYDGCPQMAQPFAALMGAAWQRSGWHADALVPVPLHARRRRERGFNQSELLARHLSPAAGVPMDTRILSRTRDTAHQARLGATERKLNVQGAFAASLERSNGKHIVIVDDVFTTGATLTECAAALLAAGAAQVSAITLARA